MNKTIVASLTTLILLAIPLTSCAQQNPDAKKIGLRVEKKLSKETETDLKVREIKISETTILSDESKNLKLDFTIQTQNRLHKKIGEFSPIDSHNDFELYTVNIDKGELEQGSVEVFAENKHGSWNYRILDINIDLPQNHNMDDAIDSVAEITQTSKPVKFIITPESKDEILTLTKHKKQLSDLRILDRLEKINSLDDTALIKEYQKKQQVHQFIK